MSLKKISSYIFIIYSLASIPNMVIAQQKQRAIIDTLDNALDLSHYLYNLHGFLPVIAPITEPAVGYGASLATVFFIPKKKDPNSPKFIMPDIVAAAGGMTENGTWFGGVGYIGFWNEDRIRYRGIAGYVDAKLKFHGNNNPILDKYPLNFTLKGTLLLQQLIFRLGDSDFLLGGKYQYSNNTTIFLENTENIPTDKKNTSITSSGVGLIFEYDNLDNMMSPTSGLRSNFTIDQQFELLGSDLNSGRISFFTHYYIPINKRWISGFRVETQMGTGDNPFYALPFISLRGIPAMRYQGDLIGLIETEQQIQITKRWSTVAFAGIGSTFKLQEEIDKTDTAWNAGVGFRYLIARTLGLKMGIDVARGPEEWAVYVVVGTSWLK